MFKSSQAAIGTQHERSAKSLLSDFQDDGSESSYSNVNAADSVINTKHTKITPCTSLEATFHRKADECGLTL